MFEKKIKSMFLIEPSLKERAEKKAKEEGLTYSAVIRKLLLDYVGGDLTFEDKIMELRKEVADIKQRLADLEHTKEH